MSRKKKIQITSKPDIYYPDIWNIGKKIPCIFCQLLRAAVLDLSRFYCSLHVFSIMANDYRSAIKSDPRRREVMMSVYCSRSFYTNLLLRFFIIDVRYFISKSDHARDHVNVDSCSFIS